MHQLRYVAGGFRPVMTKSRIPSPHLSPIGWERASASAMAGALAMAVTATLSFRTHTGQLAQIVRW